MATWAALAVVASGAGPGRAQDAALPWQAVAEVVNVTSAGDAREDEEAPLDFAHVPQAKASRINYALKPRQAAVWDVPENADAGARDARVLLGRWQGSSWKRVAPAAAKKQGRQMQLPQGIPGTGFFQTSLTSAGPTGKPSETSLYALVVENWKKDLLLFCRHHKQQIERQAHREMIRATLAVSHWDHVMELASASRALTGGILRALARAVRAGQVFEAGGYPDLVRGLNKLRLRRFPGALIEEFVLFVPACRTPASGLPLIVCCDGSRFAARDRYRQRTGYVDLWWHTVTDKDVDWKSYQMLRDVMSKSVTIDPDRVYVAGECANGLAAMSLALNYPDHWAECAISLGNTYRYLAGNALNLPLLLCKGGHNEASYDPYLDFAMRCFEYHQCPGFKGSRTQDIPQLRGAALPQAVRVQRPRHVSYTIESLRHPTAYWVTIEGREDENLLGNIEAVVEGQTIRVTTRNVDAYRLDLAGAPVDTNRPIQVVENGGGPQAAHDRFYIHRAARYRRAAHVKNSRLPGSLRDAFTDAYVVVWGSGDPNQAWATASEQVARVLAGTGPCCADAELAESQARAGHLILVGTPRSNRWLARVDASLPVHMRDGGVVAGDLRYEGPDLCYLFIYPSPLNAEHYVAVFGATSPRALATLPTAYEQMKSLRPADVGVCTVARDGRLRWHLLERFSSTWTWHERYTQPVMTIAREHPVWQWQQWLAATLRRRLNADAVFLDEPFLFPGTLPTGLVTYRDLFNSFRNDWLIEVRLRGADLRKMAMAPFVNPAGHGNATLVVDGVTLAPTDHSVGGKVLTVAELQNDRLYRAVMSEPCLKGESLGVVPQDYQIVDTRYLVPLLASILGAAGNRDMDAELECFRFRL